WFHPALPPALPRFRPSAAVALLLWSPLRAAPRQYWPKLSPLGPPVKRSTREPSSSRGRQAPVASSRTSSVALPPSESTALSVPQQRSPVAAEVSEQAL